MADEIYPFTSMDATIEGNLGAAPKRISKAGKTSCVVARVAVASRNSRGEDVTLWMDIKTFGTLADNVHESYSSGKGRLIASGPVEFEEYNEEVRLVMNARTVGGSNRWNTVTLDSSAESPKNTKRSRDDDDDDDDDEEKPARARRRSRDDDDGDEEKPARRARRRSNDDQDNDEDDDDDDEEKPARRARRRSNDND